MLVLARQMMPIVSSALERGQHVRLTVTGGSMRPFLQGGGAVELEPLKSLPTRGDIVLVRCGAGSDRYVLHRVVRVRDDKFFIRGDAQPHCEGPFTREDILGVATTYEFNGRVRRLDSKLWRLIGLAWHRCHPLTVWLLRLTVHLRAMATAQPS